MEKCRINNDPEKENAEKPSVDCDRQNFKFPSTYLKRNSFTT